MGVINTSPESFYKKSVKTTKQQIAKAAKQMEEEGADFVDVGGMSTAPYLSTLVSEKEESRRISNAIQIIQQVSNLPISVDTCRATVADHALRLGAEILNDISGLKYDKNMLDIIQKHQPSLVLCAFSKKKLTAGDQISKTTQLLKHSLALAKSANISTKKIVLDPAIGFFRKSGKGPFFTRISSNWVKRDLSVLENLSSMKKLGQPLLVSVSNKSFIGKILKKDDPADRLAGSLAAEVACVLRGADIIRTHNVGQTKDAIRIVKKIFYTDKGL